jgi:hypothetical protein
LRAHRTAPTLPAPRRRPPTAPEQPAADSSTSIRALILGGLVLLCAFALPDAAGAATCTDTWKSAGGGEWDNAANWSSGLPVSGSDVCIEKPVTVTVATGYSLPPLGSLDVGGETTSGTTMLEITIAEVMKVDAATIDSHGVIDLDGTHNGANAGNATLAGGTITNEGTIEMKGAGYWATMQRAFLGAAVVDWLSRHWRRGHRFLRRAEGEAWPD